MINTLLVDLFNTLLFPKSSRSEATKLSSVFDHYELNLPLLAYLEENNSFDCYVLSSSYLLKDAEVQNRLQKAFSGFLASGEFGLSKSDSELYIAVCQHLQKNSSEVAFIDDTASRVEAAERAGLSGVVYIDTQQTIAALKELEK